MLRKTLLVAIAATAFWMGQPAAESKADHCYPGGYNSYRPPVGNHHSHHHGGYGGYGGYGSYRPVVPPVYGGNPYGGYSSYYGSGFNPAFGGYGAGGFPRGGSYGAGGFGPGFSLYIGR